MALRPQLRGHLAALAAAASLSAGAAVQGQAAEPLTAQADPIWPAEIASQVREGTRLTYQGHYDRAEEIWASLQRTHPDHPAGALFAVETLYFKHIYDDRDPRYDDAIEALGQDALAKAEALSESHPESGHAHLFIGHTEILLGRLDAVRGRLYRAGRHAEIARDHLERALELDPTLDDARYWIGVYSFYASTLPELAQKLSWLWFIPEPDREGGLAKIRAGVRSAELEQIPAEITLLNIYIYHEPDWNRARDIALSLHERFPDNTLLHFELLEVLLYRRDHAQVIEQARTLERNTGPGHYDAGRRGLARIWRARAHVALGELAEAEAALEGVEPVRAELPTWGEGWLRLARGQLLLGQGRRARGRRELEWVVDNRERSRRAGRQAALELARLEFTEDQLGMEDPVATEDPLASNDPLATPSASPTPSPKVGTGRQAVERGELR